MVERIVSRDWQKTVLANDAIDLMNEIARASFEMFHVSDRKGQVQRIASNRDAITQKLDALDKMLYKSGQCGPAVVHNLGAARHRQFISKRGRV